MTNVDIVRIAQSSYLQKGRPDIKTGMEVEVYQKIKEGNKERVQRFKGIVIKTAWKSELEKTITVRRKQGAFGVEKIFAVHSPTIEKIEVLRQFKVRRKSIKYIRDLTGKAARLKEVSSDVQALNQEKPLPEVEMPVEAPKQGAETQQNTDTPQTQETETPVQDKAPEKAEQKAETATEAKEEVKEVVEEKVEDAKKQAPAEEKAEEKKDETAEEEKKDEK